MSKLILSINAGSSSVKVSVYTNTTTTSPPTQLAEIQIAGLTAPPAKLSFTRGDHKIKDQELPDVKSAQDAFEHILKHLIADTGLSELSKEDDIEFACHRVVHGGSFTKPTRIDQDTLQHLETLSDLAPLHNAPALEIVQAVHKQCPNVTNVAFFDTAFHSTLPAYRSAYAIDPARAKKNQLRKYGFHGLSYAYIARACTWHLRSYPPDTNLIACHLGSGASVCAIQGGKSVDTSMGLTPLSGLPGATRSGDVDPSLIFHFTHEAGAPAAGQAGELHITRAEQILNQESGWKALTGTTDFGVISQKAASGDEACKLAFEMLVDRLVGYIGSYFVKLGGEVNALVFAGGIGEKGTQLREAVMRKLKFLSFVPDWAKNAEPAEGEVVDIGYEGAEYRILLCRTDEQAEMARECAEGAEGLRRK